MWSLSTRRVVGFLSVLSRGFRDRHPLRVRQVPRGGEGGLPGCGRPQPAGRRRAAPVSAPTLEGCTPPPPPPPLPPIPTTTSSTLTAAHTYYPVPTVAISYFLFFPLQKITLQCNTWKRGVYKRIFHPK